MTHSIKTADDLRWVLAHTQAFRGGQVTDVHVAKRLIFDEESGRDITAGTVVTVVVRYHVRDILRIAKLTLQGVSDFSVFEQDGRDGSGLGMIQVELHDGRLRFWFDPQGNLYAVCEEAMLEEVSAPHGDPDLGDAVAQWIFQADSGEPPTIAWLLRELDAAGIPCSWKATARRQDHSQFLCWDGELVVAADANDGPAAGLAVQAYGPIDGAGFGIRLQSRSVTGRPVGRLLRVVSEVVTQRYSGTCLAGQMVLSHEEWMRRNSTKRRHYEA